MLTKLFAIVGLVVGLAAIGGGAAWAWHQHSAVDCCAAGLDCCNPPSACCFSGDCCAAGLDCCNPPSACCGEKAQTKVKDCCAAGEDCCAGGGSACCGDKAK